MRFDAGYYLLPDIPNEPAARLCQNESADIWRGGGIRAPPTRAGFRAARAGFASAVWADGRLRRKRFGGGYAGRCRAGWFLLRGVRAWWGCCNVRGGVIRERLVENGFLEFSGCLY